MSNFVIFNDHPKAPEFLKMGECFGCSNMGNDGQCCGLIADSGLNADLNTSQLDVGDCWADEYSNDQNGVGGDL